jgi:uncharacterized protein YodC (DUF2158 family)
MKLGSIVKLKSGGPNMTIVGYRDASAWHDETFTCIWFDDKNEEHSLKLPREAIELV